MTDSQNSDSAPASAERASLRGKFFLHISPPSPATGKRSVRIGVVLDRLGEAHYLLEFRAPNASHRFSNVFSVEQLQQFAFFETPAERQAFLDDLFPG